VLFLRELKMKISVFGLGYVGCITAACFAGEGHDVIGVDVNPDKVGDINAGKSPLVEKGLLEKIGEGVSKKKLRATVNAEEAVLQSDVSFLCVGTPSRKNGSLDTRFLENVSEEIGKALRNKDDKHLIVNRSTCLPGTLKRLEEIVGGTSGKSGGQGFFMAANPEFLREGTAIADFYDPPYTVIGIEDGVDECAIAALRNIYDFLSAPLFCLKVEEAEMMKYANNYFHALKITFANEIGRISKNVGVDSRKIMELVVADKKLNLSHYYMKPGFAFGGSCLPKDLRALSYFTTVHDTMTPLVKGVIESNDEHIDHAFELITEKGRSRVGFIGLSFKPDTDDLRESPAVRLAERLIGKGYPLKIYDPNVYDKNLIGSNREFILQQLPHFFDLLTENVTDLIKHSEIVVITQKIEVDAEVLGLLDGKYVVDVVGWDEIGKCCGEYSGICW
jgi:GDP-mannose 6-dehydrogenase